MVSRYVIYFYIMSVIGYVYECTAMVIWTGKWDNRGFLFGPLIPIYGAGALAGSLLFGYFYTDHRPLTVFLISMFASAVLEFVVHYVLEKLFHAYWWDYSKSPFNIQGRICLPASLGFGLAGLIIIYGIDPVLLPLLMRIDGEWCQVIALLLTALFSIDLAVTLSVLSGFQQRIEDLDALINEHMDVFIGNVTDESHGINSRFYAAVDNISEHGRRLFRRGDPVEKSRFAIYNKILSKVKGYTGKNAARMNYVLNKIKDRVNRIRNRK